MSEYFTAVTGQIIDCDFDDNAMNVLFSLPIKQKTKNNTLLCFFLLLYMWETVRSVSKELHWNK